MLAMMTDADSVGESRVDVLLFKVRSTALTDSSDSSTAFITSSLQDTFRLSGHMPNNAKWISTTLKKCLP